MSDTPIDQPAKPKKPKKPKKAKSQASLLVRFAAGCERWHTRDGVAYVSMILDGHREHWPVKSTAFRRWLQRVYYQTTKATAGTQAVQDALGTIEGMALFDGRQCDAHLRVAELEGAIFVDLCDEEWRAVKITPAGWRVVRNPPVRFRRSKAMLALPEPMTGGRVEELQRQLGVGDEQWPTLAGSLLAAVRPRGPYPVINFYAEQGAGKTTLARKLKMLIDPNTAPVRCEPKEPRDLMIAASNSWLIALDNLSHLPPWLSDALCRLSTGGGFSTRTLYENDEETIFDAQRPAILTGIEESATRGDLLDRSVIIILPAISPDKRLPETIIWQQFTEALPRMLGVLYDSVSAAMARVSTVTLDTLPRMADFALWATAGETALGMQSGAFMASYTGNRAEANELALESSPIGKAVTDFLTNHSYWTGTAGELLAALDQEADDRTRRQRGWPQAGRTLSGILKRLAPNLRAVGVGVEFGTTGRGREKRRNIILGRVGESSVPSVPNVPNPGNQGLFGVDGVDSGVDGAATGTMDGIDINPYGTTMGAHGADGDDEISAYSDCVEGDSNETF